MSRREANAFFMLGSVSCADGSDLRGYLLCFRDLVKEDIRHLSCLV